MKRRLLIILLLALSCTVMLRAQSDTLSEPQDSSTSILVLRSEYTRLVKNDSLGQFMRGDVVFFHDSSFLYCDSAYLFRQTNSVKAFGNVTLVRGDTLQLFGDSLYYDGISRQADLYGNVVMINGQQKLSTSQLSYDIPQKTMRYYGHSVLADRKATIYSRRGIYRQNQELFEVAGDVNVESDSLQLATDTLRYLLDQQLVLFEAPTDIVMEAGKVYCEDGYYDYQKNYASFEQNVEYRNDSTRAQAERMEYHVDQDSITLTGAADYVDPEIQASGDLIAYNRRSGAGKILGDGRMKNKDQEIAGDDLVFNIIEESFRSQERSTYNGSTFSLSAESMNFAKSSAEPGSAYGNVIYEDTLNKLSVLTDTLYFIQEENYVFAYGKRPMLKLEIGEGDTLYVASDTLLSYRDADSIQHLKSYYDVRVYGADLQGVCDSLSYNDRDSLLEFWKLGNRQPVLWLDSTQLTADTISMRLKDGKADHLVMRRQSMILSEMDAPYYQQIKGRNVDGYFKDNHLDRVLVKGNAESIYYIQNEQEEYIGLNRSISASIRIQLDSNEIDNIHFLKQPTLHYYPMSDYDHMGNRLEGFLWHYALRPRRIIDLRKAVL